ncbi:protein phosphatase 2C domain-containing protein [Parvibaculum sp.]|uniref:protein phosphatase 2C domain-containing protein n=1 Tax=Parvibaculum sp. TaxID=2024848 RepID=UPI00391872E8
MLRILETLSDPGDPGKANEDAFGHVKGQAGDHLWVIDGATDVADGPLIGTETGAHWLAQRASALFAGMAARHGDDLRGHVREVLEALERDFERERLRVPNGRHEWPSAAMMLLHVGGGWVRAANFADCGLVLLEDGAAQAQIFGAQHNSREARAVSRTAELIRALAPGEAPFSNAAVMDYLRAARRRQNSKDGYWILGVDAEAAAHVRLAGFPFSRPVTGLVFSDGFGSLVFDYHRYEPADFVRRAVAEGLSPLLGEIRKIEREEDPGCLLWPRFKRHDDATAILFRAEP